MDLVQLIWEQGEISTQMLWAVIVLTPKENGDYHKIGLIDPFQKAIQLLMDGRIHIIELHDCLHGFVA